MPPAGAVLANAASVMAPLVLALGAALELATTAGGATTGLLAVAVAVAGGKTAPDPFSAVRSHPASEAIDMAKTTGNTERIRAMVPKSTMRARTYVGSLLTLTEKNQWREHAAMNVDERGRIAFVGAREEARKRAPDAEQVTLPGVAVPGFCDPHHHISVALMLESACDVTHMTTRENVLAALRDSAAKTPAGAWVVAFGFNEATMPGRRHLSREELDAACPEHPVCVFHYTYHRGYANSRGLDAAGIGRTTPEPVGGEIVRGARGEPSGLLIETAFMPVEGLARVSLMGRHQDALPARFRRYQETLFADGITCVADAAVPPDVEAMYRALKASGDLRIPLVVMPVEQAGLMLPPSRRITEGAVTGEGDDDLRVGPMKLWMDGADSCALCMPMGRAARTTLRSIGAALRTRNIAPLHGALRGKSRIADGKVHTGILFYASREAARAQAKRIAERGFSLAVHAIGNEGVEWALDMCEAARAVRSDIPFRIEHGIVLDAPATARLASLAPTVVTQSCFVPMFVDDPAIPDVPGFTILPLAELVARGVPTCLSSDAPVTDRSPLYGIRAAVTRRSPVSGKVLHADQAIDVATAFAMYTVHAAKALGVEAVRGSLEETKSADFVVLSADPRTPGALDDLRVTQTWLRGECVHGA